MIGSERENATEIDEQKEREGTKKEFQLQLALNRKLKF